MHRQVCERQRKQVPATHKLTRVQSRDQLLAQTTERHRGQLVKKHWLSRSILQVERLPIHHIWF